MEVERFRVRNLPQVIGYSGFFVYAVIHSAVGVFLTLGTPGSKII